MSVDNNGKIKALKSGSAVITVKSVDGGFTAECAVYVKPLSIENTTSNTVNVYPNPCNGILKVDVSASYEMQIIDVTGRVINKKRVSGSTTVELNATGIYFLKFTGEDDSYPIYKKVMVR